jgi:uncharacterized membrane protein
MRIIASILCVLILIACSKRPSYPEAPLSGETIAIDIKVLKGESPVFYSFPHKDKKINFFVVKIGNEIQSYFDACAKCYTDRLGYVVDGKFVVCKKCNVRYHLDSLKTGIGSCYPIILKGKIVGNKYIIDKKNVIEGEKFF